VSSINRECCGAGACNTNESSLRWAYKIKGSAIFLVISVISGRQQSSAKFDLMYWCPHTIPAAVAIFEIIAYEEEEEHL